MVLTDDDRLNLSALDPTRNTQRFEQMVRSITTQAVTRRPRDVRVFIVHSWRPALAFAALMALATWVPSLVAGFRTAECKTVVDDPAKTLLQWVRTEQPSSTTDMLNILRSIR